MDFGVTRLASRYMASQIVIQARRMSRPVRRRLSVHSGVERMSYLSRTQNGWRPFNTHKYPDDKSQQEHRKREKMASLYTSHLIQYKSQEGKIEKSKEKKRKEKEYGWHAPKKFDGRLPI